MLSIEQEYANAIKTGNQKYADYLSSIMRALGNDPVAQASVGMSTDGAAPAPYNGWFSGLPNLPNLPNIGDVVSIFGKGFGNGLGLDTYHGDESNFTRDPETGEIKSKTTQAAQTAASGLAGAWDLFTDPYRLGSIIIGAMFIAGGIFGLAGGSGNHIINLVRKTTP